MRCPQWQRAADGSDAVEDDNDVKDLLIMAHVT